MANFKMSKRKQIGNEPTELLKYMFEVSEKVDNSLVKNWRLKSIIGEYSQKDIFNAGLIIFCIHNKTLHLTKREMLQ